MLTRFEVENYRNFKERLVLDLNNPGGYKYNEDCLLNGIVSKMIIYGRNASGKTNLGKALMDVAQLPLFITSDSAYINANTASDVASFKYTFRFNKRNVEYSYSKSDFNEFMTEFLTIDGNTIYKLDYQKKNFEQLDLSAVLADTLMVDRFFETITSDSEDDFRSTRYRRPSFLTWILVNSVLNADSILRVLGDYIDNMHLLPVGQGLRSIGRLNSVTRYEDKFVEELQDFLHAMGIDCRLIALDNLTEGRKQLYFDYNNKIPFLENASSGTLALYNIFRRYIWHSRNASLLYLDEFDAFFHYEMAENLVLYMKKNFPNTQIIFTSHNTNLMTNRIMRPDCLFVLSLDGRLTTLNNATGRELREGHNLEKLYISGEFGDYE